jgi:hypothetical protein
MGMETTGGARDERLFLFPSSYYLALSQSREFGILRTLLKLRVMTYGVMSNVHTKRLPGGVAGDHRTLVAAQSRLLYRRPNSMRKLLMPTAVL